MLTAGKPPTQRSNRLQILLLGLLAALSLDLAPARASATQPAPPCQVGAYRLADGQIVDVGPTDGGLRWRRFDGATGKLTAAGGAWISTLGWTDHPDGVKVGFGPCAAATGPAETLDFAGQSGHRIALVSRETSFVSHGVTLKGRLVLPPGRAPVAVVVLLQGSEMSSARDFDPLQRLLPAAGVAAFVYDKRGTGASGGEYTQDFDLLADDAVAALAAARRLAGPRATRFGFQGPSQGGWVAPMAAARSTADFVIVSFGLAVSVAQEDQEAIAFQMRLKGYGPQVIAKAQRVGAAAATVFGSGFTRGFERFEAVRDQYRAEPWFKDVQGNFTHVFLGMDAQELRSAGAKYRWGTPLDDDPMPTLERLATPQLWILGGLDIDAPSAETVRRLDGLIARRRPITVAVYPTAEHGMTEFETRPDGERASTRYAAGYFRLMRDFARDGRLCPRYGAAQFHPARATALRRPADCPRG